MRLRYIGPGFIQGVPAKDISTHDQTLIDQALSSGLYEPYSFLHHRQAAAPEEVERDMAMEPEVLPILSEQEEVSALREELAGAFADISDVLGEMQGELGAEESQRAEAMTTLAEGGSIEFQNIDEALEFFDGAELSVLSDVSEAEEPPKKRRKKETSPEEDTNINDE